MEVSLLRNLHTRVDLSISTATVFAVSIFLRFVPRTRLALLSGYMVVGIGYQGRTVGPVVIDQHGPDQSRSQERKRTSTDSQKS